MLPDVKSTHLLHIGFEIGQRAQNRSSKGSPNNGKEKVEPSQVKWHVQVTVTNCGCGLHCPVERCHPRPINFIAILSGSHDNHCTTHSKEVDQQEFKGQLNNLENPHSLQLSSQCLAFLHGGPFVKERFQFGGNCILRDIHSPARKRRKHSDGNHHGIDHVGNSNRDSPNLSARADHTDISVSDGGYCDTGKVDRRQPALICWASGCTGTSTVVSHNTTKKNQTANVVSKDSNNSSDEWVTSQVSVLQRQVIFIEISKVEGFGIDCLAEIYGTFKNRTNFSILSVLISHCTQFCNWNSDGTVSSHLCPTDTKKLFAGFL
mmetsp:Transcript_10243/g.24532  ORF Transcript_10243/g.24532 Transcript_10243/m.24532 type:complete len:319 (-) Transcript_10243:496-1452(-)